MSNLPKVPAALIDRIEALADSRIKHCDYSRYIFETRTEVGNQQWSPAWNWVKMAEREAQTQKEKDEVIKLKNEIQPHLPPEPAPGAPGT